jgi:pimeloyl-ACP methyl ester carboxylesterase
LAAVRAAAARYSAGEPARPDQRLPDSARLVFASFEAPINLPFARELWNEDTPSRLAHVTVPALVLIGRKDLQVDADLDAAPLRAATEGSTNVTFVFPENATTCLNRTSERPLKSPPQDRDITSLGHGSTPKSST